MARPYLRRIVDDLLEDLLAELPALLITGPRGTGKTTSALRKARTVIRLDREVAAGCWRSK
jgi:hypothetical protein